MLILTSPAKRLDVDTPYPTVPSNPPQFLDKTNKLHVELASLSQVELATELHVSDTLAALNYQRFKEWQSNHAESNSRPALFTFKGDVFQQLDIPAYDTKALTYLNLSLRILSGYYGYLRAFDLMQPYRLEMGLSLQTTGSLQDYWRDTLTEALNTDIAKQKHTFVLNLASQEYSNALNLEALNCPVIDVIFLQERKGKVQTFGMLAKRARGMMIDFCAKQQIDSLEGIQKFKLNGYELVDVSDGSVTFLLRE